MIPGVRHLAAHFTIETLRRYLLDRSTRLESGCLEVRGFGNQRGVYQKISVRAWAHIAAYAAFVGPIDPNLVIDHLCNNPACIEPTHLRQVTVRENQRRKRGRKPSTSSCVHERVVDETTGKLRRCGPCNADAQRRWRERHAGKRDLMGAMGIAVSDVPELERFEARDEQGELAGYLTYQVTGNVIVYTHTEVKPAFQGQGVGGSLAERAMSDARERNRTVIPMCPYLLKWLDKRPEYEGIVARTTKKVK